MLSNTENHSKFQIIFLRMQCMPYETNSEYTTRNIQYTLKHNNRIMKFTK